MKATRRLDSYLLLAILLSAFAVAPLLAPGYFWGAHDARHGVYFLVEFDRSIQDGVLYPRWQPDINFGYGYPFFNIYSPLAFYLGESLHMMGLDFVASTKGVFALSTVLSAVAMYAYARRVLRNRAAALVAASVYVYVPYHLADVFLRAALADSLCFVFFPLALLGFHSLIEHPRPRALVFAGAALAGLIFSHYPLALLFMPLLGSYILVVWLAHLRSAHRLGSLRDDMRPLLWAIAAGLYAAALAAILILPVALEYKFVRTDQWAGGYYSYTEHFVYLFQFFAPTWGYGPGSVAGPHDTLPFQLGAVAVVLSVLSVATVLYLRRTHRAAGAEPTIMFHQAATVALMVLMLGVSRPVWDMLHLASFAQFPWRLLSLTTVTTALLSGVFVLGDGRRGGLSLPVLGAVVGVVILGSYPYLQPQMVESPDGPVSLASMVRFEQSSGEMTGMLSWATRTQPPTWSPMADVYIQGGMITDKVARETLPEGVQAVTTRHTTLSEEVRVSAQRDAVIGFHTPYFPGWRASIDGRAVPITPQGDLGEISVPVPAGEHTLLLRFEDTPPRVVGEILTLLAIAAGLVVVRRR